MSTLFAFLFPQAIFVPQAGCVRVGLCYIFQVSHDTKALQTCQLTGMQPCQDTHMNTEMPTLKEHAAINHLKHKSSLKNASDKNSPPESSSA